MHVEIEKPERGYCPCGKNPPSVPCISARASWFLVLSQAPALEFCSTQSCPPSQGGEFVWWPIRFSVALALLGQTQTHGSPGRSSSRQSLGWVCWLVQTWELYREEGRFTECFLACMFTPSEWTHLNNPGRLKMKNTTMTKLSFPCWCWKHLVLFGGDALQGWDSPSPIYIPTCV